MILLERCYLPDMMMIIPPVVRFSAEVLIYRYIVKTIPNGSETPMMDLPDRH